MTAAESTRRRPRDRRPSCTFKASIGGVKVSLTVGFYAEGAPCELFLDVAPAHADGATRAWASCWSRAASLALQHGCPPETLVDHFKYADFAPRGMVQPAPIADGRRFVKSIADWAVTVLEGVVKEAPVSEASGDLPPPHACFAPAIVGCSICGKPLE